MGKAKKAHRKKVLARNKRITEQTNRTRNLIKKKLDESLAGQQVEQEMIEGQVLPPEVSVEDQLFEQINGQNISFEMPADVPLATDKTLEDVQINTSENGE